MYLQTTNDKRAILLIISVIWVSLFSACNYSLPDQMNVAEDDSIIPYTSNNQESAICLGKELLSEYESVGLVEFERHGYAELLDGSSVSIFSNVSFLNNETEELFYTELDKKLTDELGLSLSVFSPEYSTAISRGSGTITWLNTWHYTIPVSNDADSTMEIRVGKTNKFLWIVWEMTLYAKIADNQAIIDSVASTHLKRTSSKYYSFKLTNSTTYYNANVDANGVYMECKNTAYSSYYSWAIGQIDYHKGTYSDSWSGNYSN